MVYSWDAHRSKCYRLYIEEKKHLEEIMEILRIEDNFTPSKRAFQTQFRRWHFPAKQKPAHKDGRLVARVKELWETNLSQKEMLQVLNGDDGFEIKHRELMRLRTRNRWLLRAPNPDRTTTNNPSPASRIASTASATNHLDHIPTPPPQSLLRTPRRQVSVADTSPGDVAKGQRGGSQQAPEDGHVGGRVSRRGRQRMRPGQLSDSIESPRFPSETTLDESRSILGLEAALYHEARATFARICDEEGVSKKTTAGSEKWEAVKGRLVDATPFMQSLLTDKVNLEGKRLALDVICTDVTKRMRSSQHKLTIAEAKGVLGINPEEYRTIRQNFSSIIRQDHVMSKTEAGPERWEALKDKWQESSPILQRLLTDGARETDKLRAIDVVARDVMKRLRDDHSKSNKGETKGTRGTSEPSPPFQQTVRKDDETRARISATPEDDDVGINLPDHDFVPSSTIHYSRATTPVGADSHGFSRNHIQHDTHRTQQEQPQASRQELQHNQVLQNSLAHASPSMRHSPSAQQPAILSDQLLGGGLPIDPQIHGALPILLGGHQEPLNSRATHSAFPLAQELSSNMTGTSHPYIQNPYTSQPVVDPPVAVYLRLHPSSPIAIAPSIWIATLTARTLDELRQVAVKDFSGAMCGRVEGILGEGMTIEVSRDDELTAYLAVLGGRNNSGIPGPPCFYVHLVPAGWKT